MERAQKIETLDIFKQMTERDRDAFCAGVAAGQFASVMQKQDKPQTEKPAD